MSTDAALTAAFREWRGLAETEGDAIRDLDWKLVAACQASLAELQTRITHLKSIAQSGPAPSSAARTDQNTALHQEIAGLIKLEQHNQDLLSRVRAAHLAKMNGLDQATHNLKRIKHSYTPARPAAWNSYS